MIDRSFKLLPGNGRSDKPFISVCIPNYNGAEYIERCICSVLSQERDYSIEIILHDDASTDTSVQIIRTRFPDIKILASEVNVGFCISNNRMVAHSKGEFLLLLNNDAVLRPGSLKAFKEYVLDGKAPAILGLPQYSLYDGSLVDRGYEFDLFMNPVPILTEGPAEVSTVTGACLWMPRILWNEIGGFPDWFGSVAEDIFLCHTARLLGYPVIVLAHPGFDHWIGRNFGGGKVVSAHMVTTCRRRALSERNKTFVMMICYPLPLLLLVLPLHGVFLAVEAFALLLTGTSLEKIRVIYFSLPSKLVTSLEQVMKARRRVQINRRISFWRYFAHFKLMPRKLVMLVKYGMPKLN